MTHDELGAEPHRETSAPVIAGIDIGGTKISAVLTDETGAVLAKRRRPARPRRAVRDGGRRRGRPPALRRARRRLAGAGVGAAGVIDQERGVVVAASATFTDWSGSPRGRARGRLGAPGRERRERLPRRAALAARRRATLGIARHRRRRRDRPRRRGAPMRARRGGEIGHTRASATWCAPAGNGHLETLASGTSIARRYRAATDPMPLPDRGSGEGRETAALDVFGRGPATALAASVASRCSISAWS
jgi:glucokinase